MPAVGFIPTLGTASVTVGPDPETARRSVPSAWPGGWAGSADSSGLTQLSTSIFHFPVETGEFDGRSGYRDGRRTCRPAGPRDCPSVCTVGMAGQLGWECRLEWADTTVHIHLSLPSIGRAFLPWIIRTRRGPQPEEKAACSLHVEAPGGPTHK